MSMSRTRSRRGADAAQVHAWEDQLRRDADELTHSLSPYLLDAALATVHELGRVQPETVIHGDLHAVQNAFWGRRHGFRRARTGPLLTRYTEVLDHLADLLTKRG
jgi:hypothetical protein